MIKILKKLCVITLIIVFTTSCVSKKDVLYFQNANEIKTESYNSLNQKIEIDDILSIKIFSIDIESSRFYNLDLIENSNQVSSAEVMKLKGYLVNSEGNITLPVLGTIKVTDKTTSELEKFIFSRLTKEGHLKEPSVVVRNLNSKVTVLGEVKNPGTFTFTEKNLTLLQVIGMAGDLTINGQRKDILLIREGNNTKKVFHIDLTSTNWFGTEAYYIKQNDIIVINPNQAKIKSAGLIGNPATLVSVLSLLLTAAILLKK